MAKGTQTGNVVVYIQSRRVVAYQDNLATDAVSFAKQVFLDRLGRHLEAEFIDDETHQRLLSGINMICEENYHDSESLLTAFTNIDMALKEHHHRAYNTHSFNSAIDGMIKGGLLAIALACCVPVAPVWAFVAIPVLFLIKDFFTAHKKAQKAAESYYHELKKALHDKAQKELACNDKYMDVAASLIEENKNLLLLKSSFLALKKHLIFLFDKKQLRLEETIKIHHTMNALVKALNDGDANLTVSLLDGLNAQLSCAQIRDFECSKTFISVTLGLGALLLAGALISGGSGLVVMSLVASVAITAVIFGALGLLIDTIDYHSKKAITKEEFGGFKSEVFSVMRFFKPQDKLSKLNGTLNEKTPDDLPLVVHQV